MSPVETAGATFHTASSFNIASLATTTDTPAAESWGLVSMSMAALLLSGSGQQDWTSAAPYDFALGQGTWLGLSASLFRCTIGTSLFLRGNGDSLGQVTNFLFACLSDPSDLLALPLPLLY